MLRSAEELFLLFLDENTGSLVALPRQTLDIALAGSVLMDLQLEGRIDSDLNTVTVVDSTPVGDDLLDPVLLTVANSEEVRDPLYWVQTVAESADEIRDRVIARLVDRKILAEVEEDGVLALTDNVARSRRYPSEDGSVRDEIRLRIMRVLFSDAIPDPAEVVLIGLAHAAGLFRRILTPPELKEARKRILLLGHMDLIGQAVNRLVYATRPLRPDLTTLHKELPKVRGLPVVGSVFGLMRGVRQFFTSQYLKLGPVFRVKALSENFITLAGPEANTFMQRQERYHLQTGDIWHGFTKEMGASRFLLGMDGTDHFRMRREIGRGFSSTVLTSNLPEAVGVVRRHIDQWGPNQPQRGFRALQRIVADQLGVLATGTLPEGYTDELIRMFNKVVLNRVIRHNPLPWRSRRYRRDRSRIQELCRNVLEQRQLRPRRTPDLIDVGLALHQSDPLFLPEVDLPIWALVPFVAGIDTAAGATAFMLYALLKHPDLQDRMRKEADELFGDGEGDAPTLESLRKLDVTNRIAMESLRMYPVVPALRRIVASSFEFGGHYIPAGENLFIANAVPHYLPEFFPDPERFDIDRYLPGRNEHKQPGAFAPYGLGAHRCLGANLANLQMALILATLLHEAELELCPANYRLKIVSAPFQAPDDKFKFRVTRRRQLT